MPRTQRVSDSNPEARRLLPVVCFCVMIFPAAWEVRWGAESIRTDPDLCRDCLCLSDRNTLGRQARAADAGPERREADALRVRHYAGVGLPRALYRPLLYYRYPVCDL